MPALNHSGDPQQAPLRARVCQGRRSFCNVVIRPRKPSRRQAVGRVPGFRRLARHMSASDRGMSRRSPPAHGCRQREADHRSAMDATAPPARDRRRSWQPAREQVAHQTARRKREHHPVPRTKSSGTEKNCRRSADRRRRRRRQPAMMRHKGREEDRDRPDPPRPAAVSDSCISRYATRCRKSPPTSLCCFRSSVPRAFAAAASAGFASLIPFPYSFGGRRKSPSAHAPRV